eukprot:scaffold2061_cov246-Pinguiococcus_pyrenoidosus.AAC.11
METATATALLQKRFRKDLEDASARRKLLRQKDLKLSFLLGVSPAFRDARSASLLQSPALRRILGLDRNAPQMQWHTGDDNAKCSPRSERVTSKGSGLGVTDTERERGASGPYES